MQRSSIFLPQQQGSLSTLSGSQTVSPAAERLRYILNEEDDVPTPTIFTEMDTLQHDGDELEWKESASFTLNWDFSPAATGTIMLDLEGYSLPQIVDDIVERQVEEGLIVPELRDKISYVLLRKHRHQTKKPIHRSLADIGKSSSSDHAQSRSMNDISDTPSTDQLKNKFMKKIPRDAEASNVLVGEVDFLEKPFVAFVRLAQATTLGGLTEVPVPTSDVAYKARDRDDLIAGIDEFLDEVIVLPPGEWDPKIRIEPPKKSVFSLNELGQMNGTAGGGGGAAEDEEMPAPHELGEELAFTGRFCGGLFLDIKRKLPWFPSDFYEGFHIQSISAVLFIYLGCITNAITFGGLLGDATDNYQGVMESFLGTALAGTVFCLLGGQPLIILSSTGPILIFEKLLFEFSNLISFIFISDAIKKMVGSFKYYPINRDFKPDYVTAYKCECLAPDPGEPALVMWAELGGAVGRSWTGRGGLLGGAGQGGAGLGGAEMGECYNVTALDWSQLSKKQCLKYGGSLVGKSCKYVPDLALMSFILFFGTYSMTVSLKKFKFSRYFPTKFRTLISDFSIIISILVFCMLDFLLNLDTPKLHVPTEIKLRKLISDFSIFMSIMTFVGLDMLMGLKTPKLIVPTEFKPTRADRGWLVMPFGKNPWWMAVASFVPALLVTILIFMDQQISAVIVNRKENKLKKGCGYHLDLLWVGVLMAACSFMGLPWYVAATVISIAHIDSLKMESESSAPGEQPQFLGVREQRLTGILVFVLTGVSIFLAPILLFWDRIKLYLMPAKHQPDFTYLRHVPLRRVHLFTLVQIVCLAVLWILKSTVAAIIFPMLDLVFSQHDLAWLDDILPEKEKKKKEDEKKKKDKKKPKGAEDDSEEEPKSPAPPPVKIPMETIAPPMDPAHIPGPPPVEPLASD
ncbi:hypothetical protein JZ751_011657, partial [Albula glossodonta]